MKWLLPLAFATVAHAQPDDAATREAALFGEPEPPAAPASPTADREADLFGEPPPEVPAAPPPAWPEDPLTIGGRLWIRLNFLVFQDTDAADQPVHMPNLLDVYLDARPVDRLRAYASGRLSYDPTTTGDADDTSLSALTATADDAVLDELWLRFDIERAVFVTLGAQHLRWGTGRIWNPTDVLNRDRRDPLAPADLRTGVPLLRVDVPWAAIGGNLQVAGRVDGADRLGAIGGGARVQAVFGPAELSVMGAAREGEPLVVGADLSAGVGPIDVYGEAAVSHGHARRWTGRLDVASLTVPTAEDRDADWIPQLVAGFEWPVAYGDGDIFALGAEYLFNDAGYADADLYPWLLVQGDFDAFYVGRHYAAAYAVLAAPGTWDDTTFALTGVANLSDRTVAVRLGVTQAVRRRLFVEPFVAVLAGPRGGEFRFSADVEIPGQDAVHIPPPLLQAGLWLRVPL